MLDSKSTFYDVESKTIQIEVWVSGFEFDRNLKWIEHKFNQNSQQGKLIMQSLINKEGLQLPNIAPPLPDAIPI